MTFPQASILLEEIEYSARDSWEQTRFIMWSNLSPHLKIKASDIMQFSWEKDKESPTVTEDEITEFKKRKGLI